MEGKVAVVTGGSRGIGRATCLALARRGATVVACARDEAALASVSAEAKKQELAGKIEGRALDVTRDESTDPFVEAVTEEHNRIDILVNNAGITRDCLLMVMDDEQFDDVLTTNLRSVFRLTRAVSRQMVRQRYGRIINVGSVSGVMGNVGQANYSASKAGLAGFTKSVAKELGKYKVTCNLVAPGFIVTDMTSSLPEVVLESAKKSIPLGRLGQPEEVAELIAFLAGDSASYITGQVVVADGGMHM